MLGKYACNCFQMVSIEGEFALLEIISERGDEKVSFPTSTDGLDINSSTAHSWNGIVKSLSDKFGISSQFLLILTVYTGCDNDKTNEETLSCE